VIVVDTNIIAGMTFPTDNSSVANLLHQKDPVWEAPVLWKSEFLNILSLFCREGLIDYQEALDALDFAERLVGSREHPVSARAILDAAATTSFSAYDCEFIVLAKQLGTKLITTNKKLTEQFPDIALTPEAYLEP